MTAFHAAFAEALEGHPGELLPLMAGDERTQAALAVYRNTTIKARIDALQANYPTIADLTGEEWFRAAAHAFVEEEPGSDPAMVAFGQGFPDWLVRFAPARSLPFLAPTARLDRVWTEAHLAPDAEPMTAAQAAALGPALAGKVMTLHPSLTLFCFDWSVPSLWLAHRYPEMDGSLEWRPTTEALAIWRPRLEVQARRLAPAEYTFLQACRSGRPLAVAGAAAQVGRAGQADVRSLLADLINAGVFAAPIPGNQP